MENFIFCAVQDEHRRSYASDPHKSMLGSIQTIYLKSLRFKFFLKLSLN